MRIGELSKRSGLSRDTIRYYEREGLIASAPSKNPANTYRDYPEDLLETLTMIGEAQEAGLPLSDMRTLLDAMEGRGPEGFDVHAFLDTRIIQVEDNIRRARRFLKTLRATRAALEAPITAEEIAGAAEIPNNLTS